MDGKTMSERKTGAGAAAEGEIEALQSEFLSAVLKQRAIEARLRCLGQGVPRLAVVWVGYLPARPGPAPWLSGFQNWPG
jgi:hypothetical protein